MEPLFTTLLPVVFLPFYLGAFVLGVCVGYLIGGCSILVRLSALVAFCVAVGAVSLLAARDILLLGVLLSLKAIFTSGGVWSIPAAKTLVAFLPVLPLAFFGVCLGMRVKQRVSLKQKETV